MTTQELTLEPLTAEAFTPFGDLIHSHERDYFLINDGQCRRYHRLAKVETGTDGGAILSLFRPRPISLPHTLVLMERHPSAARHSCRWPVSLTSWWSPLPDHRRRWRTCTLF